MAERRIPQSTRSFAKRALRHYGTLTSAWRSLPDFAVIGAKRGGTTSLYNYLLEHPSVTPMFPRQQHLKGVHYFDSEYWRGGDWYRSHFPLVASGRHLCRPLDGKAACGEASPYYLFHPLAAGRLAAEVPDIKLVVMLRDPVERAWSHYKERVRNGGENLSFEEAIDAEDERLKGEADRILGQPGYRSVAHEDHSYVAQGRYREMLERWFSSFDRQQFFIAASEDFYRDPEKMANEVWSFLGLPGATLKSRQRHNYHPAPDLEPETRARLTELLRGEQEAVEELLGRQLPWTASQAAAIRGRRVRKPPSERVGGGGLVGKLERPSSQGEPSVTVIIATRDRPQLLARAVESVMAQDYTGPLECIVVFDQSAEAPVGVAVPAGRTLRTVANSRTPGLAGARNTGILASNSELIATCDDDDTWSPEKLRLQVALLQRTGAEMACSGQRIVRGETVVEKTAPRVVTFDRLLRERVWAIPSTSFVLRRQALVGNLGLVDENLPGSYAEDYDMMLRVAWRRPLVSVEQPLVDVYWHEQSFFAERWAMISSALSYLLAKHPAIHGDRRGFARIKGQIAFADAARGSRREAVAAAGQTIKRNPGERRAYLALLVAAGVIDAGTIVRMANERGRGI